MRVLGIDTSASKGGVAVVSGTARIAAFELGEPGHQAEKILVEIDQMFHTLSLKPGDIDLFAVTVGPGSFTGLRIGMACAQGLAFGVSRPLVGVTSLEVLAAWARQVTEGEGRIYWPVIDARRDQIYHAGYVSEGNGFVCASPPAVDRPEALEPRIQSTLDVLVSEAGTTFGPGSNSIGPIILCGDGVPAIATEISRWPWPVKTVFPPFPADAASLTAELGLWHYEAEGAPVLLEPIYLRPADARKPARTPGLAREALGEAPAPEERSLPESRSDIQ